MKICIVGWHYRASFLKKLAECHFKVFVIQHREGDTQGIPAKLYENRGLEFGAYQQYLDNHWDGISDVLFCHDDVDIQGLNVLDQIETLSDMNIDHSYIFNNFYEEWANAGCHGRAMWCKASWIKSLQDHGGFPVDLSNTGNTAGKDANKGAWDFRRMLTGQREGLSAIVPGIEFGRRGWMTEQIFVFKRTNELLMTPIQE